jgi:GH25 family lysozyme M1 (1,4-beta-N-acetylmuramidase)
MTKVIREVWPFYDGDRLIICERSSTMTNPLVIDISHYQPTPHWDTVKAGGTLGVILKATEGTTYKDPTFDGRGIGAREAGLCVASYHFLRPGRIAEQMAWYISIAEPAPGSRLVIDFEDPACTFEELEDAARWLLDNTDCEVTVYGSNVLVDACKGKSSMILEKTSLWQARYSSSPPDVPDIWPTWSLWQYTDKAAVTGITGPVDGNKWNGDPSQLENWFYRPLPTPQPQPLPSELIDMIITTPPGVRLRLIVNGQEYIT